MTTTDDARLLEIERRSRLAWFGPYYRRDVRYLLGRLKAAKERAELNNRQADQWHAAYEEAESRIHELEARS